MKKEIALYTKSGHEMFLMIIKENQGYFINQSFVSFMVGILKKPALVESYAAYMQSSVGIQEQIKMSASKSVIDMTCGDKENNFVNWVHIAHGIGIELTGQFLFEHLTEAHESRANLYEALAEEKNLIGDYYIQSAQQQREKALYFKNLSTSRKRGV